MKILSKDSYKRISEGIPSGLTFESKVWNKVESASSNSLPEKQTGELLERASSTTRVLS